MFGIYCDCGEKLFVDESKTLDSFLSKVSYIKDDLNNICDIIVNDYLIYTCGLCGKEYKYTYAEVEKLLRESITYDVKAVRKAHVFRNDINPALIDPDNGMEFCGKCLGVDNEGNCYTDVVKQCSYRREK